MTTDPQPVDSPDTEPATLRIASLRESWLILEEVLSEEVLQELLELDLSHPEDTVQADEDQKYFGHSGSTAWMENTFLSNEFMQLIPQIAKEAWGLEVDPELICDPWLHNYEIGDRLRPHTDYQPHRFGHDTDDPSRPDLNKATLIVPIQLADAGGVLLIDNEPVELQLAGWGDGVLIPGYMVHEVTQVYEGRRRSISFHFGGPPMV